MANCNGCKDLSGIIWNTCDSRPIVRITDAVPCINLGLTADLPTIQPADVTTNPGDLTTDNLTTGIKNGLLMDKVCLPKLNTPLTADSFHSFWSLGIDVSIDPLPVDISAGDNFTTNAPDGMFITIYYSPDGVIWTPAVSPVAAIADTGSVATDAFTDNPTTSGNYYFMFFGSMDNTTFYPLLNASFYRAYFDFTNTTYNYLSKVSNKVALESHEEWILGQLCNDNCSCA